MKKNIKFIIFIILAIIALYFTRVNYGDYSKNKSISACVLAQKNKASNKREISSLKFMSCFFNKLINKFF